MPCQSDNSFFDFLMKTVADNADRANSRMFDSPVSVFPWACAFLFLLSSCVPQHQSDIQRPRDVWAMNTVLDMKPRMLSLALNEEMYVAYDTKNCLLYKIWKGGIHLDGAPFKDIKTLQPSSWGAVYWEDSTGQNIWQIESKDSSYAVVPRYGGYTFIDNQIVLRYEILLPDERMVEIKEQPEYGQDMQGNPTLVQTFTCTELSKGISLRYARGKQELHFSSQGRQELVQTFSPLPSQTPAIREVTASKGKYWLDRSGCNTCHEEEEQTIGPGYRQIASRYAEDESAMRELIQKVKTGGAGNWGEVPMSPHGHLAASSIKDMLGYILSLQPSEKKKSRSRRKKKSQITDNGPTKPGFGEALTGIHPAYDLTVIRPEFFKPRVGALAFMPDSSLLVSTWDSVGAVYRMYGVTTGDTNQIRIERIAQGLAEPLGLEVVDGDIFVLQKQELTQLLDHDGDGLTDEYRNICNAWDATPDFHEYSYGLVYKDGVFWANLGLAMRLMPHEEQLLDRGKTIKIFKDGRYERVNSGLRQPNGIGWGPEGELFVSENQGKWSPACQLIHIQPDVFHGCRLGRGLMNPDLIAKAPAVWLPQDEIGNSPGEPVLMQDGPYKGQTLLPEVTHGGIKRIFLEKVGGEYQGCVFRFSQGLGAGINRLVWGQDGALYTGGIGMNGNWGIPGFQYGLHRLIYNDHVPFEMLEVRSHPEGMEILFTEPLAKGQGEQAADYLVQQWRYEATEQYGGPKIDLKTHLVREIAISENRRQVILSLPHLKVEHVVYIRLGDDLTSTTGHELWSSEVWYTLNHKQDNESS